MREYMREAEFNLTVRGGVYVADFKIMECLSLERKDVDVLWSIFELTAPRILASDLPSFSITISFHVHAESFNVVQVYDYNSGGEIQPGDEASDTPIELTPNPQANPPENL